MELIGVFDIVADKDDTINMYDASTYWDYNQYAFCSNSVMEALAVNYSDDGIERAFFYVEDAAQLDNVIKNVQHIDSINWNNFIITANDEVYQNISSALSDTGTLITTLIIVITAVSMVLIILILSMYRQACGDSPICAGNPTDRGGGLSAGLPIQQAGCRCPGYAVRQGVGECHRHTGAFHAGGYRGRYPADYSSSDIQHLGHAFEAETDLIPDGIKETRYEPQNEFRNTGGFTYRPKMEKDAAAFLPASLYYDFGVVGAGDCRRTGGAVGRTAGRDRSQFYCQCQQRLYPAACHRRND